MEDATLITVEAAARRLSMSRAALYPLVLAGEIESVKIGRSRRIPVEALEAFIKRLPRTSKGAASDID